MHTFNGTAFWREHGRMVVDINIVACIWTINSLWFFTNINNFKSIFIHYLRHLLKTYLILRSKCVIDWFRFFSLSRLQVFHHNDRILCPFLSLSVIWHFTSQKHNLIKQSAAFFTAFKYQHFAWRMNLYFIYSAYVFNNTLAPRSRRHFFHFFPFWFFKLGKMPIKLATLVVL
jgi:hypothetical protein